MRSGRRSRCPQNSGARTARPPRPQTDANRRRRKRYSRTRGFSSEESCTTKRVLFKTPRNAKEQTKAKRHTILAITVVEPATAGDFEAIKALVRENECLMAVGKEEGNEDLLQMNVYLHRYTIIFTAQ